MIIFGITFSPFDLLLISACGTLIVIFIRLRFVSEMRSRDIFNDAAKEFRRTVLNSLSGLFPVSKPWPDENFFPLFKKTIPIIESAAAEFRRYVRRQDAFAAAVKQYVSYCKTTDQTAQARWELYKSEREELGKPEPSKEFERLVHNLFSFADEK